MLSELKVHFLVNEYYTNKGLDNLVILKNISAFLLINIFILLGYLFLIFSHFQLYSKGKINNYIIFLNHYLWIFIVVSILLCLLTI